MLAREGRVGAAVGEVKAFQRILRLGGVLLEQRLFALAAAGEFLRRDLRQKDGRQRGDKDDGGDAEIDKHKQHDRIHDEHQGEVDDVHDRFEPVLLQCADVVGQNREVIADGFFVEIGVAAPEQPVDEVGLEVEQKPGGRPSS